MNNRIIEQCIVCTNHSFDRQRGIICRMTNFPPEFDNICGNYDEDRELKQKYLENISKFSIQNLSATKSKRFANYILDNIIIFIISFFIGFTLSTFLLFIDPSALDIIKYENKLIDYTLGFIVTCFYYIGFEFLTGKTPAKYITKTKVVRLNGGKPDFQSILLRSLCRFIPFEPLSFLGSNESGWHDKFSQTRVTDEI